MKAKITWVDETGKLQNLNIETSEDFPIVWVRPEQVNNLPVIEVGVTNETIEVNTELEDETWDSMLLENFDTIVKNYEENEVDDDEDREEIDEEIDRLNTMYPPNNDSDIQKENEE